MAAHVNITAEVVVRAYRQGVFPMAQGRDGPIQWYSADPRAVLPLDSFHVPKTLRRRVRQGRYEVTSDQAFEGVIRACAKPRRYESDTWISERIVEVYLELHRAKIAHSIEAWGESASGGQRVLVGGLYGVAIGGAFFGESMFHRATDASKVCLVHLVEHLHRQGFVLLDVQFTNPHLRQFGVTEVPGQEYLRRLGEAIERDACWGELRID